MCQIYLTRKVIMPKVISIKDYFSNPEDENEQERTEEVLLAADENAKRVKRKKIRQQKANNSAIIRKNGLQER